MINRFNSILLISIILVNVTTLSQVTDSTSNHSENLPSFCDDINSVCITGIKLINAPISFDADDWIKVGSVAALTGTAFLFDDEINKFWMRNKSNAADKISEVGRVYGEITYAALFSGSLYLGGKIFRSKEISKTGKMLLEGLFYAGTTTTLIKFITGRSRPYLNEGDSKFRFFQTKNDYNSFPSGHTTVAFTLSTVLSESFDNTYASIFLYTLASSTLWQRMYSNNHWLSDTLLGASIGYFIGQAVVNFNNDYDPEKTGQITFLPTYANGILFINLNYSF